MEIIVGFALCFQRIKDTNLTLDSHLLLPLFLRRTHMKGKIKTVEPTEEDRAAFLVSKKNDGLLKNFMMNLRRQFNDPTHFVVYRVVADRVGESVESLKSMLAARDVPQNKAALDSIRVSSDESPAQKLSTIDPEKVDWKELERHGVSPERLEVSGISEDLLYYTCINIGIDISHLMYVYLMALEE